MKAAIFKGIGEIEVTEVEMPVAGPGEVVIKVAACGICGSDLHMYRQGSHADLITRVSEAGPIPGHEFSGTIVEIGEGVTGYRIGDRVVGVSMGGMAEYVPVPVNPYQLVHIPDDVSFEDAATTEPLADALHIANKAQAQDGENVVVFGAGIIGLSVIQAFRASGKALGALIAIDISERRLEMAKALGATHVVNPRTSDPIEQVRKICGVAPMYYPKDNPPNVHVVCDCVGHIKGVTEPPILEQALAMVKEGGARIVCFGAFESSVTLNLMNLIFKEPTILGSEGYTPEELSLSLRYMQQGKVDRRRIISHTYPLERVKEAFEVQKNYADSIKVLLVS